MAVDIHRVGMEMEQNTTSEMISRWMRPAVVAEYGEPAGQVAERMKKRRAEEAVVVKNGKVCGLLTSGRLFRCLIVQSDNWRQRPIDNSLLIRAKTAREEESVFEAWREGSSFPAVVVVDEHRHPCGVVTPERLVEAFSCIANVRMHNAEVLDIILESAYEGIVVVDEHGVIRKMNRAYLNFLGAHSEEVIGRYVQDVIENTRMHIVIETGIPERGEIQEIQGQKMVVHRIPIWQNGVIAGAIGVLIFEGVTELYKILERIHEQHRYLVRTNEKPHQRSSKSASLTNMIGKSEQLTACKSTARKAARTMATVLITGESGTGKEMIARSIHENSHLTQNQPFVSVNCAAIPESLLEAELFGYEKGAFTGARKNGMAGKFERAHGGTLFLDEIGDMPLTMQAKILRVIQEREVERIGGERGIPISIRLIAATNHNLETMVEKGMFRKDLYYRLNIIRIDVPPLRRRKEDIPILTGHYIRRFCRQYGFRPKTVTKKAFAALSAYHWPGNIRELMNVAERLVTLVEEDEISLDHLPEAIRKNSGEGTPERRETLREERLKSERKKIEWALREAGGNKTKAAEKLGIHRSTLYQKLKKFSLD